MDVTGIAYEIISFPKRDLPLNNGSEAEGTVDVLCKDKADNQYLIEIQKNFKRVSKSDSYTMQPNGFRLNFTLRTRSVMEAS